MTPEEFAAEHGGTLLRLAVMLTGRSGDAEDLLQETFTRLLRRWDAVATADHPRAYARRAMINTFVAEGRRRDREIPTDTIPDHGRCDPESDSGLAWSLLATLPHRRRCVLALRYYEGLSDAEIASILSISQSTVRSTAARGLAALRDHVEGGVSR